LQVGVGGNEVAMIVNTELRNERWWLSIKSIDPYDCFRIEINDWEDVNGMCVVVVFEVLSLNALVEKGLYQATRRIVWVVRDSYGHVVAIC
jgi:hypothetical protein